MMKSAIGAVEQAAGKVVPKACAVQNAITSANAALETKGGPSKPSFTFSAEDDKKLLDLKNAGQSWKEIAKELKKPQGAIKNRFKELGSDSKNVPPAHASKNVTFADSINSAGRLVLHPDEVFDEDMCVAMARAMSRIVCNDYDEYCVRIASRIFDLTGKRVGGRQVKVKLTHPGKKIKPMQSTA